MLTSCAKQALRHFPSESSDWKVIENSFVIIIRSAIDKSLADKRLKQSSETRSV